MSEEASLLSGLDPFSFLNRHGVGRTRFASWTITWARCDPLNLNSKS